MQAPSKRAVNSKGWEMQIATNHFGHFILTSELMPLLKKTPKSRIVNVASSAQAMAPKMWWVLLGRAVYERENTLSSVT